jgi:hypothetical protein
MTNQADPAVERSTDAKDSDAAGKTQRDIAESGSSGAEPNDDDKAQEDLEADDLKGFVKDPLEQ